ncbi:uncharacterized protein LOC143035687 [Oratosquilla oratoria]|uniref:uncharacterized protein LOC143035687 n=1 Tax=Oratosquilla oratoria TaxID=337810 RepID=UPI003F75B18C
MRMRMRMRMRLGISLKDSVSVKFLSGSYHICVNFCPCAAVRKSSTEELRDETKFKKISKDPTESLKNKLNKLVTINNAANTSIKFNKLSGDYRPIISQIPTPTYGIAKQLCTILTTYVPAAYSLHSATDFLYILKTNNAMGTIASLDVESLFTSIPIQRTINYIIDRVYNNTNTAKLPMLESILRSLLHCCTTEAPFICPRGMKYQQIDGVAMDSPLGVLFANFFMGCIEEEVFSKFEKPEIYCRYIDDIFIKTTHNEDISLLKNYLQDASSLTFTIENSLEGSMPFLDILVTQQQEKFDTDTYVKPTNTGQCMNGKSECQQRYINSTISAYIRRALTHCNTWTNVHTEIRQDRGRPGAHLGRNRHLATGGGSPTGASGPGGDSNLTDPAAGRVVGYFRT